MKKNYRVVMYEKREEKWTKIIDDSLWDTDFESKSERDREHMTHPCTYKIKLFVAGKCKYFAEGTNIGVVANSVQTLILKKRRQLKLEAI